jgi:hypothetical protein
MATVLRISGAVNSWVQRTSASLSGPSQHAHFLRFRYALRSTVQLIATSPMTTGYEATSVRRNRLNVPAVVTLRVCDCYSPVRAVYTVQANGGNTEITIIEFEKTFWPASLLPPQP